MDTTSTARSEYLGSILGATAGKSRYETPEEYRARCTRVTVAQPTSRSLAGCVLAVTLFVLVPLALIVGGLVFWGLRVDRALASVRVQLQTMPEASLTIPNATRLYAAYHDPDCLIGDVHESLYTQAFSTTDTPEAILSYYRTELATRGWQIDPTGGSIWLDETSRAGWMRGDLRLQVGIARQNSATPTTHPTVYRLRISAPPACFAP